MFDPSKLDISDNFRAVIEELRPHEEKVHCVLNKCDDMEDTESLLRVYGALLWGLGRVYKGAEVQRVYIGSFKSEPLKNETNARLFEKEKEVLMTKLKALPKDCGTRKINEMVKRIRLSKFNMCVLSHLRSQMPYLWGHQYRQDKLIDDLPNILEVVRRKYDLGEGDIVNIQDFQKQLRQCEFSKFPNLDRKTLVVLEKVLEDDIAGLMRKVSGVSPRLRHGDNLDDDPIAQTVALRHRPKEDDQDVFFQNALAVALASVFTAVVVALFAVSAMEDHKTIIDWLDSVLALFQTK